MTDLIHALSALRRPRILIRAARAGAAEYRRERDLKRVLRGTSSADGARTVAALIAEEQKLEAHRVSGEATYSVQGHVAVLTALIAEARAISAGMTRGKQPADASPAILITRPTRKPGRSPRLPFAAQPWPIAGTLAAGLG